MAGISGDVDELAVLLAKKVSSEADIFSGTRQLHLYEPRAADLRSTRKSPPGGHGPNSRAECVLVGDVSADWRRNSTLRPSALNEHAGRPKVQLFLSCSNFH